MMRFLRVAALLVVAFLFAGCYGSGSSVSVGVGVGGYGYPYYGSYGGYGGWGGWGGSPYGGGAVVVTGRPYVPRTPMDDLEEQESNR